MIFKNKELEHLWPFYLHTLLNGLSMMIFPFMILYFMNLGFSFFQISVITSAYGFSMFLFEIPTGAFADGFSRKYSVVLGFIIIAICTSLIPTTNNFYFIVLLRALSGMGMTFVSGADEAWVIDNLNKNDRQDLHHEYFIKTKGFSELGTMIAPIIGAILVKAHSIKFLWFIYGFSFFINAVLIMFFTKEHTASKKVRTNGLIQKSYQNAKLGLAFSSRNKVVLLCIIAGIFLQLMMIGAIGIQPLLVSLGMAEHQLGYVYSISSAVCVVSVFFSRFFVRHKPKNSISMLVVAIMILNFSLLLVNAPYFMIACVIFILTDALFTIGGPITQTYFHKFIPGKLRATVMSVNSMFFQLIMSCASLVAGACLDLFGPQKVIAFTALFGVIAVFFYQRIKDPKLEFNVPTK